MVLFCLGTVVLQKEPFDLFCIESPDIEIAQIQVSTMVLSLDIGTPQRGFCHELQCTKGKIILSIVDRCYPQISLCKMNAGDCKRKHRELHIVEAYREGKMTVAVIFFTLRKISDHPLQILLVYPMEYQM